MEQEKILDLIKRFAEKLPRFPDGRIDYSNTDTAPVITVFIMYNNRILLLKRSDKVRTYKGKWNTVAGYLDEVKPLYEKILEELREEIGVREEDIESYHLGEPFSFLDKDIDKTWIVHPVCVVLKRKPVIKLDWEHTEYKWIKPSEIKNFDIVPNTEETLRRALETIDLP